MSPDQFERMLGLLERIAVALEGERPLTPAERAKRYRDGKKRHGERDGSSVTANVTRHAERDAAPVTNRHGSRDAVGGRGALSWNGDHEDCVSESSEPTDSERHASRDDDRQSGTQTVTRRVTGDGAFGMTVDAWREGVRSVTGFDMPVLGKTAGHLIASLQQPEVLKLYPGDPCERARKMGELYATRNKGRSLDPFDFGRWVGSGMPDRTPKPVTSRADETYTPPPVSRPRDELTAYQCRAKGLDPAAFGIDPGAPDLGTARSHPLRKANP